MKLNLLAAASLVALSATAAQAASFSTFTGGDHGSFQTAVETPGFTGFKEFDFTLGGTFDITTTFASFGAVGSVGLFRADNSLVWSWGVGGGSYSHAETFSLGSGSYYYLVGSAKPSSFTLTSTAVAAVPEPETYALLGAGLGIVGFVASRRRRQD